MATYTNTFLQKLYIDSGAPIPWGNPGSPFTAQTSVTIAANGNFVLPAGLLIIQGDGVDATLQTNPLGDGTTWVTNTSAGYIPGLMLSDGYTVRILNTSATSPITIKYSSLK